jgi:hypothetical protein
LLSPISAEDFSSSAHPYLLWWVFGAEVLWEAGLGMVYCHTMICEQSEGIPFSLVLSSSTTSCTNLMESCNRIKIDQISTGPLGWVGVQRTLLAGNSSSGGQTERLVLDHR